MPFHTAFCPILRPACPFCARPLPLQGHFFWFLPTHPNAYEQPWVPVVPRKEYGAGLAKYFYMTQTMETSPYWPFEAAGNGFTLAKLEVKLASESKERKQHWIQDNSESDDPEWNWKCSYSALETLDSTSRSALKWCNEEFLQSPSCICSFAQMRVSWEEIQAAHSHHVKESYRSSLPVSVVEIKNKYSMAFNYKRLQGVKYVVWILVCAAPLIFTILSKMDLSFSCLTITGHSCLHVPVQVLIPSHSSILSSSCCSSLLLPGLCQMLPSWGVN